MTDTRDDLIGHLNGVLDALAAHDAGRLPLADGARYTEDGQQLEMTDGLWLTMTEAKDHRIELADPESGQAVFHGLIDENTIPGLLSLRIRVTRDAIAEIEATVLRAEMPGASTGVTGTLNSYTLFMPRPPIEFDPANLDRPSPVWAETAERTPSPEELVTAVDAYFDAVEAGPDRPLPLAPAVERIENGAPTDYRSPYVAGVRRRHAVIDRERSVVFGVYVFDHPGTIRRAGEDEPPKEYRTPVSFLTPHLFKITDGAIVAVRNTVKPVLYRMPTGWE